MNVQYRDFEADKWSRQRTVLMTHIAEALPAAGSYFLDGMKLWSVAGAPWMETMKHLTLIGQNWKAFVPWHIT